MRGVATKNVFCYRSFTSLCGTTIILTPSLPHYFSVLCVFTAGMNSDTQERLEEFTAAVTHDVMLVEDDGTLFLEGDAVPFYKMKFDEKRCAKGQDPLYVSRQAAQMKGIPLDGHDDPDNLGHLTEADPQNWGLVLNTLQRWGWGGNIILVSNGNNGSLHDRSYFDRTLLCNLCRPHRGVTREVFSCPFFHHAASFLVLQCH